MNRSILIVICDFLLVSLLAFSTVDINKAADEGTPRQVKMDIATKPADSGKDLAGVMRLALEEERRNRDQILSELAKTRENSTHQEALLVQREKQEQDLQQQLQLREQETVRFQQEQAALQQQFASAQTNIENLNQQLHSTSVDAILSKEKLAAMQAEMQKQAEQAAALQQQLGQLAHSNEVVLAQKQQLAGQLQVAEVEKNVAAQQVVSMREEVKVEREEKARLAEGVKALATKSDELAQQVRESRPLAPNTIFSDFLTNRVQAEFDASRAGLFGEATKNRGTATVLITDGVNIYALCHVQDTPLTLWNPGTDWEALTGDLSRGKAAVPIRSVIFCLRDPRVLLIPLTAEQARQLGCRIYHVVSDPYKFQDAVLVGARDGYYGECKFEIDTTTPGYVRLNRGMLKGLFGQFNPSRGDLVFSRTGEFLGVMANSSYCMMMQDFEGAAAVLFGKDVRTQHTGAILSQLYTMLTGMPNKLQ
ncbi:MAG TPA: hypothetical protein VG146_01010 [Verrucomicrobiae bacterium]|nr:hypothetical protein [Verrucomicrobiae bacterium]